MAIDPVGTSQRAVYPPPGAVESSGAAPTPEPEPSRQPPPPPPPAENGVGGRVDVQA